MPASYHPTGAFAYFSSRYYDRKVDFLPRHRPRHHTSSSALPTYQTQGSPPQLPISNNAPTRGLLDGWKSMWTFKNDSLTPAKTALYTPLFLPDPGEFLHPRPAPLPPSNDVHRLPFSHFGSENQRNHDKPPSPVRGYATIVPPTLPLVRVWKEIQSSHPAAQASVVRQSKRSYGYIPFSPDQQHDQKRDSAYSDDANGARKRVRFSVDLPPSRDVNTQTTTLPVRAPSVKLPDHPLLPFTDWVVHRCHGILAEDVREEWLLTAEEEGIVSRRIITILVRWCPEGASSDGLEAPKLTLLALWYMERLFPQGLFNQFDAMALGISELVIRTFLLCLTLADKWLNDCPRPIQEWQRFCNLPRRASVHAEKTALMMLDYNLAITGPEWGAWLSMLEPSASKYASPNSGKMTAATALREICRKDGLNNTQFFPRGQARKEISEPRLLYYLRDDLLQEK
ncbi:hypothetical protein H0H87_011738 [Tephrocybe sp. NHM501043]|nr:hypothetical protein H0H87_011738 [Tephrocybe sp. NHM501043]